MSSPNGDAVPFLDLKTSHAELKQELLAVVSGAIDQAAFIGGPALDKFEEAFAAYCQSKLAVGVGSGTDALRLALLALDLKQGGPVITVPNTFIATTEAITQAGGSIELVDVSPDTCLMDSNQLEDLLKSRFDKGPPEQRPVAVIPVHLYGQCAEMREINQIVEKYELAVIEDAAQAHGATHHGQRAGSWGQMAAFSFYPGKNLGACGEAGAVTTADAALADKIKCLRDHGQSEKYIHQYEGYNARLDAIQAGFLTVKLTHLDEWNQNRRQLADLYDAAFQGVDWVRPVSVKKHNLPSRHLYVIHVPGRQGLMSHLAAQNIYCGMHYPVPLHLQPCYEHLGWQKGSFPHAEESAASLISLPIFPSMTEDQVVRVIDAVLGYQS